MDDITMGLLLVLLTVCLVNGSAQLDNFMVIKQDVDFDVEAQVGCSTKLFCAVSTEDDEAIFKWRDEETNEQSPPVSIDDRQGFFQSEYVTRVFDKVSSDNTITCNIMTRKKVDGLPFTNLTSVKYNVRVVARTSPRCYPPESPDWLWSESIISFSPNEGRFSINQTGRLDCVPRSFKDYRSLIWVLPNGVQLRRNQDIAGLRVLKNGSLVVDKMKAKLQGKYRCFIHDENSISWTWNKMVVPMGPKLADIDNRLSVTEGCKVEIWCEGIGEDDVRVTMKSPGNSSRGTTEFTESKYRPVAVFQRIIKKFAKIGLEDAGVYICTASNSAGPPDVKKITVYVNPGVADDNCTAIVRGEELNVERPFKDVQFNISEYLTPEVVYYDYMDYLLLTYY